MLRTSLPHDYIPLPPPGEDPIVLGHKALSTSLEAKMAALDEQVAAYHRLTKAAEITRPPWWDLPNEHPLLARATKPKAKRRSARTIA